MEITDESLNPCPCGQVPAHLYVTAEGEKWARCHGSCCGEWEIEFRNDYRRGSDIAPIAVRAWNDAPRGFQKLVQTEVKILKVSSNPPEKKSREPGW